MPNASPPLSSTVASIFTEFLTTLESEILLGKEAIDALRQSFEQEKLDPESLRKALFTPSETDK